jgi:cob(I)alamin adenosyltransferase
MTERAIPKIYTRKGDAGQTSLFSGERVSKADPRMEAIGAVDELVAALGLAKAEIADEGVSARLTAIQGELYLILSEVASADGTRNAPAPSISAEAVSALEMLIDEADAELPELKDFVLPGQTRASAALHLARTACRRAERRMVETAETTTVSEPALKYLNRLSDALFMLARLVDHRAGNQDTTFKSTL